MERGDGFGRVYSIGVGGRSHEGGKWVSDSFATAPRLDSTTQPYGYIPNHRPTTHRPLSGSFVPLPFSPSSLSLIPLLPLLTRALSPYVDQPSPYPYSLACLPVVPVSLFLIPSSSWLGSRERRLRARVASPKTPQTPAGTRLHPVALSSIVVIIVVVVLEGTRRDELHRETGIPRGDDAILSTAGNAMVDGLCITARDVRLMHFVSVNLRLSSTSETEDRTPCISILRLMSHEFDHTRYLYF